MLEVEIRGEQLSLLAEKAIWWEKAKTLVVADLHWGKSAHFRKHGIAIPLESQSHDELRLAKLIREYKAERLIIAGDMFHSKTNSQVEVFSHFRNSHKEVRIDLVIGNHDILKEEQYTGWNLAQHKECFVEGPFCFAHDMREDEEHFVIHGHVHPAIRIKSRGSNQPMLKLCCFAEQKNQMILPAFGQFTGTHIIEAIEFRHVYVIAEDKVMAWK